MMGKVQAIGFTVSSIERVLPFYTQVLALEVTSDVELRGDPWEHYSGVFGAWMRVVTLKLGDERLQLTQFITPPGGRPIPADSRSNDLWFQHLAIVVSDMDAAYAVLREHGVQHVSSGPQTLPDYITAAAGIRAFYFRDPDGHNLELIWFPPGKGDPRWRGQPRLFAGIDHTAIATSSTADSRRFYELLGLHVAGESENYGSEQEHLNMVFGARLHITGLKTSEGGIGVEFLEYLCPAGGRPIPADTRSHDVWHWETTLATDDLDTVAAAARNSGCGLASSAMMLTENNPLGYRRALLLRDPDGHAVRLVEV